MIRHRRATHGSTLRCAILGATILTPLGQTHAQTATEAENILVVGQPGQALSRADSTGSRLNLSPLQTPASIAVIDGEAIRARGDLSIAETEARAPGFFNVGTIGNGGTALAARGFSGQGSVLQLIDGLRLFPVAGTITFPIDPWMVERIDVLSGPASVLYGQGALGGAVNVVTRKTNTQRTVAEGEIGYGSQNTFHGAAGVGGPIGDRLSYRVDGSYRRSDGYVERGRSDSYALAGTLRWAATDRLTVTLHEDYGDQHPMQYTGTPLIDGRLDPAIRANNYNVSDAYIRYRDSHTTLQADWTPSDRISITNQGYVLTSKRQWRDLESYCWVGASGQCHNGYNYSTSTPGNIYRTDNYGIGHDQTQWGDTGSVTLKLPLSGAISTDLVAGFEVNSIHLIYANDFGSDTQEDSVNPYSFNPGTFYDTQGVAPRFRTTTNEYAVFAENRLKFGEKVSLITGIRAEHDEVKRWSITYPATGGSIDNFAFAKTLNNTTWRVGGVYQPVPTVSLYAQYSTGTDPLGTLTTYSGAQTAFSNATGNQVEIGAKGSFWGGRGTATLAAYRIVKKGLLYQQTLTSPIQQVGQQSSKGIEATLSLNLPAGLGIDANGTVLKARYDDFFSGGTNFTGKAPPNVPQQSANLWLRWDATRQVRAQAGLRYVGQTWSNTANTFRVPAYAVVDAGLSWAMNRHASVNVHVYNLLDKAYAQTTYNDEQWVLGRPRSVDVSLRTAF